MINHHQAVRTLVLHDAGCLFSLPIKSVQVLWLAAGIGTGRPGTPIGAARTLHMSPAGERTTEARAITQLRAAGRHGCHTTATASPAAVATGTAVSLPAALIVTAAQTVAKAPLAQSTHVASKSHRAARRHRATVTHHRGSGRGAALQTAAIATTPHDSMLIVWALLLLAAVGACAIVTAGRRRGTRWAGEMAAAAVASGRDALFSIGIQRRPQDASTNGSATSRITVVDGPGSAEEIAAPSGGWAPALFAGSETAPVKEITAPEGGWAPPLFSDSEAAPIEEITAPEGGWAPPLFADSEAAPIEEIAAPTGGWAPPLHELSAPLGNAARPAGSAARGRALARWRELRAHPPTTLGVAGGAIAAILAVAAKPQRSIGRRHR